MRRAKHSILKEKSCKQCFYYVAINNIATCIIDGEEELKFRTDSCARFLSRR